MKSAEDIAGEAYQVVSELLNLNPTFAQSPEAKRLLDYFNREWTKPGAEILPFELPKMDPPMGLLMSMAIRADHGLAIPGYYDQDIFNKDGRVTHTDRLTFSMMSMRQLWEEVVGQGFYKPEKEEAYAAQAFRILKEKDDDENTSPYGGA